jgi:hypothetical protein
MKIVGYDENSHSLLVSFASDTTKFQDPTQYPILSYQPYTMFPDVTDVTQIPKLIAAAGMWQAQIQETKEAFISDPTKESAYKNMVGQTLSYNVTDLAPQNTTTTTTIS